MAMTYDEFLPIVKAFYSEDIDPDHDIEVKWDQAGDGSTKWHTLFHEGMGPTRYGLFPHDAKYRIRIQP